MRRRSSPGSSRSAGLDDGIGLSVGDHICSTQTEPILRVKEGGVTKALQKALGRTVRMNKPGWLVTPAHCA